MNKDINISITTIKRHAKRLHKILQKEGLTSADFKLTASQEIFAKSLGCNNWHELYEILKDSKEVEEIKPLIMVIDDSDVICKSITLFLSADYECLTFRTTQEALEYINLKPNKKHRLPNLILCDTNLSFNNEENYSDSHNGYLFAYKNIKGNKYYNDIPIVYLTTKEDKNIPNQNNNSDIDRKISNLVTKMKFSSLIEILRNYINQELGTVDKKYWYLLFSAYIKEGNSEGFKKAAQQFSYTFSIVQPEYKSFVYPIENYIKEDFFLYKPFSKDSLNTLVKEILE